MKKKLLLFAAITVSLAAVAAIGLYCYDKPRQSLAHINPDYTLNASDLYAAFQENEQRANARFVDKVILVNGVVDVVQSTDSTWSVQLLANAPLGGINCRMMKSQPAFRMVQKGQQVRIKGRCVGFLMDVNLVDAVLMPSGR